MKPDYIKYGAAGIALLMLIQWMTTEFSDGQKDMLKNQNMMITTLEHSNVVQEAMLKEIETGNNLNRRRLGLQIKD